MIQLPNGCSCSELKVSPSNWQSPKASVKQKWYIYYRFYDPSFKEKFPKGKLRIIKGMNNVSALEEKQKLVQALINLELTELKTLGYNPILEKHLTPACEQQIIGPATPFVRALRLAFEKASYSGKTYMDIKSVLGYVEKAAIYARLDYLPIENIKPSHILNLLEQCGRIKKCWTANNYNVYVKYLSILFGQLLQHQAVEYNPMKSIKKKKTLKSLRPVLTKEQCQQIDQFTKAYDERLWCFIHLFFHSGSRITEILRVQGEHVDLRRQKVKYLLLKGRQYEWVERTIKDIALPFWQKALEGCGPKDYVFSKGLRPGEEQIRAEQITRRWRRHIKEKLGIDCDFYSLKHLNTDQTSELLDLQTAAAHNSHKSTHTTLIYAVGEKERVHQRIKQINNSFA